MNINEHVLREMGVIAWRARANGERATDPTPEHEPRPAARSSLDDLEAQVAACRKCSLCETRRNTVFGVGDPDAELMFIGEAPGAEEDRRGLPFVGRAGQLLDAMLEAIDLKREDCYIANVLKCRPPNNRDPMGREVHECHPYLLAQIDRIRPRVLVALGRFAAQALLETDTPIGRLRGAVHRYGASGTPLIVTYHPAYLLRSPLEKRKSWRDLKLVRSLLGASDASRRGTADHNLADGAGDGGHHVLSGR